MIRAELKGLSSTAFPEIDLEQHVPEDPECFGIYVEAYIGAQGEAGEDIFGFMVCTPRWLETHPAQEGFLFARHHLILPRYDYSELIRAIHELCEEAANELWDQEGEGSWETLARRLSRYMRWEFEDYMSREQAQQTFERFLQRHGVNPVRYKEREREEMTKMFNRLGGPEKFTGKEASEIRDKLFEEFGLPRD